MPIITVMKTARSKKIRQLEERYQEPIEDTLRHLYYDQGLTLQGVADILGVPRPTVAAWMVRFNLNLHARAARELSARELSA